MGLQGSAKHRTFEKKDGECEIGNRAGQLGQKGKALQYGRHCLHQSTQRVAVVRPCMLYCMVQTPGTQPRSFSARPLSQQSVALCNRRRASKHQVRSQSICRNVWQPYADLRTEREWLGSAVGAVREHRSHHMSKARRRFNTDSAAAVCIQPTVGMTCS